MDEPAVDPRRPGWVYRVGDEPDPRISLANERTALAWMRTALALIGGGLALVLLESLGDLGPSVVWVAGLACAAGGAMSLAAIVRWARVERAVRLRGPLPSPGLLLALGVGLFAGAAAITVIIASTR